MTLLSPDRDMLPRLRSARTGLKDLEWSPLCDGTIYLDDIPSCLNIKTWSWARCWSASTTLAAIDGVTEVMVTEGHRGDTWPLQGFGLTAKSLLDQWAIGASIA